MTINDDRYAKFLKEHEKLTSIGHAEARILESLRFRDQDQSTKSGAVLAFTGLMIATSIVQLASSPDSMLHINPDSPAKYINLFGLAFLFASAFLSLYALVITSKYSQDAKTALFEFHSLVAKRSALSRWATILAVTGSASALLSFFLSVL